jgi:hypothetical protein
VDRYVRLLVDAGIVIPPENRRNQVWRSAEVLGALNAFAARAGQ